ncbi:MAG: transporter substrate-binding domain-containing protein [Clostridia bacterium]
MKKLISVILSITMLISSAVISLANEKDNILKVAVCADFAPFEYWENGELKGFDIDFMNLIGEYIGYEIEYIDMKFDNLLPSVANGDVDCAISAIVATEERERYVDFTRPYFAANVIYKDEDFETEALEMYSIIFKEGTYDALYRSTSLAEYETIFMRVEETIEKLILDGTTEKIMEKYNLNNADDENSAIIYEYVDLKSVLTDSEANSSAITLFADEWAVEDVTFAYEVGITDINKEYAYQNKITREEFCELIYNFVTSLKREFTAPITNNFTDTENDKILMLNGLGIINGKSETEFAPKDYLTREEAATIIVRMVNKIVPMEKTEMWFEYDDADDISEWALDSVQTISNLGFMKGVGDNKFAPKDTYTTEQAIVTLVRVYKSAQDVGAIEKNSSVAIIGGGDGPTSIIVDSTPSQNATDIIIGEDVKLDKFYIDEAVKLATETSQMAADKMFISMYVSKDMAKEICEQFNKIDYSKPKEIYYLSFNPEKAVEFFESIYAEEVVDEEIDFAKVIEYQKFNLSVFANIINGGYGANTLALTSVLTNREGYIMPKDFKKDFCLYMVYEGDFSVLVSFGKIGDGVIEGRMQFVKNGENADISSLVGKLYSLFGKECITVGTVK